MPFVDVCDSGFVEEETFCPQKTGQIKNEYRRLNVKRIKD